MKGIYRLADVTVEFDTVYSEVHTMCRDYVAKPTADMLHIHTTEEDIDREDDGDGFPRPYLETLAVYRKMATILPSLGGMLMHGSVIAVDGEGYMFTANSGTGKSTHVRLWREKFGNRAVMVNDDKPLLRIKNENLKTKSPIIYGTPWDGKHHLSTNISVPLKAICILERGEQNEITPLTLDEAFPMLWQQTFHNHEREHTQMTLRLMKEMSKTVRFYRLKCNMNPEAADVAYGGMKLDENDI